MGLNGKAARSLGDMKDRVIRNGQKSGSSSLAAFYGWAKDEVIRSGFSQEIEWQRKCNLSTFDETDLLSELAWVCFCSGFKEVIVRRAFDYLSLCFCDWESAAEICRKKESCFEAARAKFNNPRKLRAVIHSAEIIHAEGFAALKEKIIVNPLKELRRFPYIGNVTAFHLAKNLGFQVAKPDRHLVRLARAAGVGNVQVLCNQISSLTGDPINVVDVVLWRYATLGGGSVTV